MGAHDELQAASLEEFIGHVGPPFDRIVAAPAALDAVVLHRITPEGVEEQRLRCRAWPLRHVDLVFHPAESGEWIRAFAREPAVDHHDLRAHHGRHG